MTDMTDQRSPATPRTGLDDSIIREAREDAAATGLREALRAVIASYDAWDGTDGSGLPFDRAIDTARVLLAAAPAAAADARRAEIDVERLALALHETKGGGPFGEEGTCECRDDAAAIAAEYDRRSAEREYMRRYDARRAPATADTPEAPEYERLPAARLAAAGEPE